MFPHFLNAACYGRWRNLLLSLLTSTSAIEQTPFRVNLSKYLQSIESGFSKKDFLGTHIIVFRILWRSRYKNTVQKALYLFGQFLYIPISKIDNFL